MSGFELTLPTQTTFFYNVEHLGSEANLSLKRVAAGEPYQISFTFRQGTQADDEEVTNYTSRRSYKVTADALNGGPAEVIEVSEVNPDIVAKIQIVRTLADTNFTISNKPALEFVEIDGVRRVKNSSQFDRMWEVLKKPFTVAMYQCCLEVNPDWGNAKSG